MNQPLNHYYIFYTVATYHSFSAAAKQLYISQPAVSKAVSKLESELAIQLFHRAAKGVRLTCAGELLYKQLEIAFQAIENGEEALRQAEKSSIQKLSIGTSTTLCKYVLLPFLRRFIPQNPDIRLSISCQHSFETFKELENGTLDIGLTGETDRLTFHPIQNISDVFVCTGQYLNQLRKQAHAAGMTFTADSDLFSLGTLLMLPTANISRQQIDRYLQFNQIPVGQILEVSTMDLLIDFALTGLGIACVVRDYVEKELTEGTLVLLSTKVPVPSRKIGISYSSRLPITDSMERFLKDFRV